MTNRKYSHLAVCSLVPVLGSSLVAIAAPSLPIKIDEQLASTALAEFVQQSGLQVLYPADGTMDSVRLPQVVGTFTADAALSRLLEPSGFSYIFVNAKTVAIQAQSDFRLAQAGPARSDEPPRDATGYGSMSASTAGETSEKGLPEILVSGSRSLNADIQRTEDDIQPYVVLTREEIKRTAAVNVNDLLRTHLTMNYVPVASDQMSPTLGAGSTSTVSLRGLSSDQTLILIDGRRAGFRGVFGTTAQADLNSIPLSAIERIEVLPATASGIYGGGATGGVVNVILRRDYSGVEAGVTYENSFNGGGAQRRVDLNGGHAFNGGKTSVLFSGSYSDTSDLLIGDRRFYAEYVRRRAANVRADNPSAYLGSGSPPLGATSNISGAPTFEIVPGGTLGATCFDDFCFVQQAENLTLKAQYGGASLGSPITHLPNGYGGAGTDSGAALLQNAGNYNLDLANTAQAGARNASLLNAPSILALSSTLRHQFNERVEVFLTLSGARNDARFRTNELSSFFTVDASAPNNPFQQSVNVNVPIRALGAENASVRNQTSRSLAGAKFGLGHDWSLSTELSFERNDLEQSFVPFAVPTAASDAISSGAIDVFVAPPPGGFDLSQYFRGDTGGAAPSHGITRIGSVRLAGPVAELPAGPLVISTLIEYTNRTFSEFTQSLVLPSSEILAVTYSEQESSTRSAYLEARVPLVSSAMGFTALHDADLQLAGRYESYRNLGGINFGLLTGPYDPSARPRNKFSSFDPTIGLRIRPVESVAFRASYGTGFFPPGLNQLQPAPPFTRGTTFVDHKRNEVLSSVVQLSGGNPDLQPEESKSKSFGVIINPTGVNLRLSVDWTRIEKRGNISGVPFSQFSLDQEDVLPGVVIRNPDPASFGAFGVGPVVAFNSGLLNATRALTESYDFNLNYSLKMARFGTFDFSALATRLVKNSIQQFPAQPEFEYSGTYSSPTWQGNAALTWNFRAISATWTTRYLGDSWLQFDHAFSAGQGSARIPSATYHDVAVQYQFGERMSLLSRGSLQVGVKNLLNTRPRYFGYVDLSPYDTWGSPMLATYYASLTARF